MLLLCYLLQKSQGVFEFRRIFYQCDYFFKLVEVDIAAISLYFNSRCELVEELVFVVRLRRGMDKVKHCCRPPRRYG